MGNRIDTLFLDLLELLRKATYAPVDKKIIILAYASDKIDGLRFFTQLLWEARLAPEEQYILLGIEIENIGKIIGGWRRDLLKKTSTH